MPSDDHKEKGGKTSSQPTPPSGPSSCFLTLPIEIRRLILTQCIQSSRWMSNERVPGQAYRQRSMWSLSHTIPQSLLLTNKLIRQETFQALAAQPELAVVCNSWPSGNTHAGWVSDPDNRDEVPSRRPPPRPNNDVFGDLSPDKDFGRVKRQCERLAPPKGINIVFKLYGDSDCRDRELVDELEGILWSLITNIFLVSEYLPTCRRVHIDLDGVDEAMMERKNGVNCYWGVPSQESDDYLDKGWEKIVEEVQVLRARADTFTVGWKGWRQDHILKILGKK